MKCVCPMGGDRTCPDDCPLAVWSSLSSTDRKAQRKPIAEKLYKDGFTMEQIATQLGVSQGLISGDLKTLLETNNVKGQGTDTLGRKKSTGRPKGRVESKSRTGPQPQRRTTTPVVEQAAASLVLDQGKTYEQTRAKLGLRSVAVVKTAVAREEGRRERQVLQEPEIDPSTLSQTAQDKLAAAIRQAARKHDAEFEQRVRTDLRRLLEEMALPRLQERERDAERVLKARKGVFKQDDYNKILRCLHPDLNPTVAQKNEAFRLWHQAKLVLLSAKDDPRQYSSLPTLDELRRRASAN